MSLVDIDFFVQDYLDPLAEVRVKNPISAKELRGLIKNIYAKTGGPTKGGSGNESDFFGVDNRLEFANRDVEAYFRFPLDFLPPGILPFGPPPEERVATKDFENRYLRYTGWHITTAQQIKTYVSITIEPTAKEVAKPTFLYHAAPTEYRESIRTKGLFPRNRYYDIQYRYKDARVYLGTSLKDARDTETYRLFISDRGAILHFDVWRVDTTKFKRFKLRVDNTDKSSPEDDPFSVYTKTHIPAKALKLVKKGV